MLYNNLASLGWLGSASPSQSGVRSAAFNAGKLSCWLLS